MKAELILIVWLTDGEESQMETLCDSVGDQFGFSKRGAGVLPTGKPVGYIYSKGGDIFECLMFHMGARPHDKIHVLKADEEVCAELKRRSLAEFGASVQIIGESNRRPK